MKGKRLFVVWVFLLGVFLVFVFRPTITYAEIHEDLKDVLSSANTQGKLLLVDFYGAWCPWCLKMDETIDNSEVQAILNDNFYYYKLDVGRFERHGDCMEQYGVEGIPHIIIFNPDGSVMFAEGGYMDVDNFKAFLAKAIRGK